MKVVIEVESDKKNLRRLKAMADELAKVLMKWRNRGASLDEGLSAVVHVLCELGADNEMDVDTLMESVRQNYEMSRAAREHKH